MTSERKKVANRSNARRSTGPRTPAGKAAVALNSIRHGLLSRQSLVKGESEADLVGFGKRLRAQLAPVGELELLLADRIVSTAWRLRRALAVEAALISRENSPELAFTGYAAQRMTLLARYEATLERGLFKALHELQRIQAARQGEPAPLPSAVDVEVSVSEPDTLALLGKIDAPEATDANGHAERASGQQTKAFRAR
jgi:hypothetical protein